MSKLVSAEIVINGVTKPVPLSKTRQGSKIIVLIEVPANEVGVITRRVIKNANGQVMIADPPGSIYVNKPDKEITFVIPIESTWKGGTA